MGSVLTAALALGALPGLAGSHVPRAVDPVPAGAFQPLPIPAHTTRSTSIVGLDEAFVSDGALTGSTTFIEPGAAPTSGPTGRAAVDQPDPKGTSSRRPPRFTLKGQATFYDTGYTAMRLPRGTTVVICGGGGCITRVVNDYGPQKPSRVVDLYRPDFFKICGCGSWSGVTNVTVYVY